MLIHGRRSGCIFVMTIGRSPSIATGNASSLPERPIFTIGSALSDFPVHPSVPLCPSVCPSHSVRLSVRLTLSVCLSVSLCPSVCPSHSVRLSVRPTLSVCLSVSLCPSVCPSHSVRPSVPLCPKRFGQVQQHHCSQAMSNGSNATDYFKIIPNEVLERILHNLSPVDRIPLESVGDRRLRSLVISFVVDSSSLKLRIKHESEIFKLLKYHNLRKFVYHKSFKPLDKKKMSSFAQSLSQSCPLIDTFVTSNDGITILLNYIHFIRGHSCNNINSITFHLSSKDTDNGTFGKMTSIVKQTPLLTSIGLEYSGSRHGVSFDRFLKELKTRRIVEANLKSFRPESFDLFFSNVTNLSKLTIDNLRGKELKKIITRNPDLKYLAVSEYFDVKTTDLKFLSRLSGLKVFILTIDAMPTCEELKLLIESFPPNIEEFMMSYTSNLPASVLASLPTFLPSVKKITLNCSFDRNCSVSKEANVIRDIICEMKTLTHVNLFIDGILGRLTYGRFAYGSIDLQSIDLRSVDLRLIDLLI